jgi:peptide/nickel transport system ATP-binding protein
LKPLIGLNLNIRNGETLGVVGETGCGKTMTGLSILVLVPPPGRIEGGHVLFNKEGKIIDLLTQNKEFLRDIRGKEVSVIFQDPKSALNPVYTIQEQISEVLLRHRKKEFIERVLKQESLTKIERKIYEKMLKNPNSLTVKIISRIPILKRYERKLKSEVRAEVIRILRDMRIPDPERVADMYPHELSGGMAQRVVIGIALACNPKLLIADEPTTNLDVTVQFQILNLIRELKSQYGSTIMYITHDLGVIAEMCNRVAVMYAGNVVEIADVVELFKNPLHPYTKALLESIPRPGRPFKSIEGTVPSLVDPPKGCRFHPRCTYAMDICKKEKPIMKEVKKEHYVQCHLY